MNTDIFSMSIRKMESAASVIASNVAYIRKQLPEVAFPGNTRNDTLNICGSLDEALRDVRTEFLNLADKLGLRPGEAPYDPDIVNPDPRATMGMINRWLHAEMLPINPVVQELQGAATESTQFALASVLVTESAANILKAYLDIAHALDAIGEELTASSRGETQTGCVHRGVDATPRMGESVVPPLPELTPMTSPLEFPPNAKFADVEDVPVVMFPDTMEFWAYDTAERRPFPGSSYMRNGAPISEAEFWELVDKVRMEDQIGS